MTVWRFRISLKMFLLLPVIVAGIWWWSTWPDRTARRFVTHLVDRDLANVSQMLGLEPNDGLPFFAAPDHPWGVPVEIGVPQFQRRSFADWLLARGSFSIEASHKRGRFHHGGFVVCRGAIDYSGALTALDEAPSDPGLDLTVDSFGLKFRAAPDILRELSQTDSDVPVTLGVSTDGSTLFISGPSAAVAKTRLRLGELDKP